VTAGDKPLTQKKKLCSRCKRVYQASESVCVDDGTILTPVVESLVGSTLAGKYEILSKIGQGGMSIVYKAHHQFMERTVAIKVLQSQLVSDQTSTKRFQQEAQAASLLKHPNVIGVHDYGIAETSKQPYIVMDYLIGESLSDVIKRDNHIEQRRAVIIFLQACDALEHAHKKGVLHRDLKASNIMLVEEEGKKDIVKVVDFGIAKFMPSSGKQPQNLTQTGEIFGSPIYMSPEQCLGETLDARSDVYSMGVLMYESLTGVPPLMGDTIIDTMKMHVEKKPLSFEAMRPDLKISKELEAAVFRALEKQPVARFQSMQEFYNALELVAYSMGITDKDSRQLGLADSLARVGKSSVAAPVADYQASRPATTLDKPYSVSRFGSKTGERLTKSNSDLSFGTVKRNGPGESEPANDEDEDHLELPKDKRVIAAIGILLVLVVAGLMWFGIFTHH
jgi:serine/threonine-protein kinase